LKKLIGNLDWKSNRGPWEWESHTLST